MQQKNNNLIIGLIAVVILAALVGGTILFKDNDDGPSSGTSTSSSNSTNATTNSTAEFANATFKDGSYSATGSYSSPGGNEEIAVSITIKDGSITDTSVTPKAASRESREYQLDFADTYKSEVVGKALAQLSLGKISGSSLTSRGFNQALDEIRTQAKI